MSRNMYVFIHIYNTLLKSFAVCLWATSPLASWKVIHFGKLRQQKIYPQTILQICGVTGLMVTLPYGPHPTILKTYQLWPLLSTYSKHTTLTLDPAHQCGRSAFAAQHRWEDLSCGWLKERQLVRHCTGRGESCQHEKCGKRNITTLPQTTQHWRACWEAPQIEPHCIWEPEIGSGDIRWGDSGLCTSLFAFSAFFAA